MPLVVSPNAKLACMNGAALLLPGPERRVVLGAEVDGLDVEEERPSRLHRPASPAHRLDHCGQGDVSDEGIRDNGGVAALLGEDVDWDEAVEDVR